MRNRFKGAVVGLVVVLVSSVFVVQMARSQSTQGSPWKFNPKDASVGDGGPAPKRDLTGTWAGPGSSPAVPRGGAPEKPTLTPLGQQLMSNAKPIGRYSPAGTNDPHARYCDPVGFPQNAYNEARGLTIATMPDRVVLLLQYMNVWREVWTDGRALPTTAGGTGKDAIDPTYNGYSVGHWEDDYNFMVETVGLEPTTWATKGGQPHSGDAKVTERFTRVDKNDMQLSITMTDPAYYTAPFVIGTENFRWVPNQQLDDFTCIPSEVQEYLKTMADPAGFDANAPEPGRGGGRGGRGR